MAKNELKFGDRLICLKSFKFAGRLYLPGADFKYTNLSAPWRRVKQMYEARMLVKASDLSLDDLKALKASAPVVQQEDPPAAPDSGGDNPPQVSGDETSEEGDESPEEEDETPEEEGDINIELLEVSTGLFDVLVDGKKVNEESLKKREALKLAEAYEVE